MRAHVAKAYSEENLVPGTPTLPLKNIRSSLLLMLLITVSIVWVLITLMRPDILPIKRVRVEGEFQQLAPDRLEAIVTDTVRGGFFNVNVEVIKKILLLDPWVHQVTVLRNWPDSLTVQVSEQVAVARWGDSGLINPDGALFTPDSYTYPENLPTLRGPSETYGQMLAQYLKLQEIIMGTGYVINGLTLNDRRSWTMRLSGGPLLILGKKNKLNRLARFVTYIKSGPLENLQEMETVDLRYTNGFAVRWKDKSYNFELGRDRNG